MAAKITVRRKNRLALVRIEIFVLAVFVSHWLGKKYEWDRVTGVAVLIITVVLTAGLFFRIRIFRYIFSILFSLLWGFLVYGFADSATTSSYSPWLAFGVVAGISLWLHKDYFTFESKSVPMEFE
ncbi:hypothetical protein [Dyadobacter psychrotolerans]|uniref:Uncharacterized protein n=1 Tax=Dyadobacter psychrotolerans TaxID=2541721 RepID=A0A4V2Z2X2_9BACT|nr:hypothetical protein [Dyadobacter psychrotolerans]TDE09568.1 hypothetical protein E0F88_30230 [Dyadobacter psychrotolerans]